MALSIFLYLFISTVVILIVSVYMYIKSRGSENPLLPIDWPVVGILPSFVANLRNFHDYLTAVLAASGCNFKRAKTQGILSNPEMVSSMATCCRGKVADGLLPFLARMASAAAPFDMQELCARLVFDQTATPVFGVDPGCLSPHMPSMRVADAMDTVMEVGFFRQTVSPSLWKAMRWLDVGPERRLAAAHTVLHGFVTEMMEKRNAARQLGSEGGVLDGKVVDIVSHYVDDPECSDAMLRKTLLNYMIGGRDTIGTALPWLLYSLANNPRVVSSIRKELAPIASRKDDRGKMVVFEPSETKPLVYLQATLFESLRLYPPGPLERKNVVADDVLPSGHRVRRGEAILVSIYAMGRMESVWGKDSHEFRPERWLSEDGTKLRFSHSDTEVIGTGAWRTCMHFAHGFCENGSTCRFWMPPSRVVMRAKALVVVPP
ncbi:cytochrome P450 family 96 subfamily A polypeptide 1 [Zea mays]|uniref:Cytochrome P450 family 96 subfamily A polypeptide 1 n=1 Tax=Zea mays TaxID=4577 RepID=A0A1D6Q073_MAIZE|nr:cytochrome P450 family 96 subfamily A polypeptide 1 [Zea mays]